MHFTHSLDLPSISPSEDRIPTRVGYLSILFVGRTWDIVSPNKYLLHESLNEKSTLGFLAPSLLPNNQARGLHTAKADKAAVQEAKTSLRRQRKQSSDRKNDQGGLLTPWMERTQAWDPAPQRPS